MPTLMPPPWLRGKIKLEKVHGNWFKFNPLLQTSNHALLEVAPHGESVTATQEPKARLSWQQPQSVVGPSNSMFRHAEN